MTSVPESPPRHLSFSVNIDWENIDSDIVDVEDLALNPIALAIAGTIETAKLVTVDGREVQVTMYGDGGFYEGVLPEPLLDYDAALRRGDPVLPLVFDLELRLVED